MNLTKIQNTDGHLPVLTGEERPVASPASGNKNKMASPASVWPSRRFCLRFVVFDMFFCLFLDCYAKRFPATFPEKSFGEVFQTTCLENVWKMCGKVFTFLEHVWKMSGTCPDNVRKMSEKLTRASFSVQLLQSTFRMDR